MPFLVNKKREAVLALQSRRMIRRLGINTPNPDFSKLAHLARRLSHVKRHPL
jgi:hypothetical protein